MGEEGFPTDDEASKIVVAFVVNGDAGERLVLDESGKFRKRGRLWKGEDYGAGVMISETFMAFSWMRF